MNSPPPDHLRAAARSLSERVDWNLLRTFSVVAQELSISRAAARLHLSQPAVSQALKRLEQQVGRTLLERRGPRFELTPAGAQTLLIASEVQGQFARLDAALEEHSGQVRGKVRVLTVSGVRSRLYDDYLTRLHREHPGIGVDIVVMSSDEVISALQQKTAHFGLAVSRFALPGIAREPFIRERYGFFCSDRHPLFGRTDLTLDDLRQESFVSFSGDAPGGTLASLSAFRERLRLTGDVLGWSANVDEVLRLVRAGFGVGCLPEHLCERELAAGRLQRLPPLGGLGEIDVQLMWNADQRLTQAEQVFLDGLRACLAATPMEQRLGG